MVLFGVGELAQNVLQVIFDNQMMTMCAAKNAKHLQSARGRVGVAEKLPVAAADYQ